MKPTLALSVLCFLSFVNQSFAQNSNNALLEAAKDYQQVSVSSTSSNSMIFVPYYLEGDSIKYFEKVSAKLESKAIGMGYGGVNTYYTIFNSPTSSVRFSQNAIPKFIITVDPGTDVLDMVLIVKADVAKNKTYRRFVKGGQSMTGSKDMSTHHILPELKLIGKDKYQIILPALGPGEYAFMPIYKGTQANNILTSSGNYRLFCFGIK